MTLKTLNFKITGLAPLLMPNGQTADPLNKFSKAIKAVTSKRSKTDADHEEMAKLEWFASLYLDKGKVIIPDFVVEASLVAGARKSKLGKQAEAAIYVENHAILEFDGMDLTPEELFDRDENRDCRAVRVQKNKVMRTRFIAKEWSANISVLFDDSMLNSAAVKKAVADCGYQVGLCDWRPKYGRFEAELL